MSKSIFDPSVSENLSDVFTSMTTPKAVEAPKVVSEKKEEKKEVIEEKKEVVSEEAELGSDFNKLFESCFAEECGCDKKKKKVVKEESDEYADAGLDIDADVDVDVSAEGDMVEVPRALLDELYSYIEDSMGSEDESSVDDIDFELPEEGTEYSYLKNLLPKTSITDTPKQKNKTSESAKKTGIADEHKSARDGKVSFLKNILGSYLKIKDTPKQKNDTPVGETPTNK